MAMAVLHPRADRQTKSVLRTAQEAVARGDYPEVVTAAYSIGALCRTKRYLVKPLIALAHCLERAPEYALPAVRAAETAARYARQGSLLERHAVTLWVSALDGLAAGAPEQALAVARRVAARAPRGGALRREALRLWARYVEALAARDPAHALSIARRAAAGAPRGSPLQREALRLWARYVEALAARSPAHALSAVKLAAAQAPRGSPLQREAWERWLLYGRTGAPCLPRRSGIPLQD